jgi:Flp pilus assembly protein TadD
MNNLTIRYSTSAKALPPQPIRMANAKWGGSPEKMENGSEPQPWHCLPFVEGSTYGLELIYPYETECHVVGAGASISFEWDFAKEPGGGLGGDEFSALSTGGASKYYSFNTGLELEPPSGYVLRAEPHPRYFTDDSGTVPLALIGHLPSEPHPGVIVFRAPRQGERHIFRKGEAFAQIILVPPDIKYDTTRMNFEESAERRDLEHGIEASRLDIAENIWRNPAGVAFNNHYKVLARAFARDGLAGVKQVVHQAQERRESSLPKDKTVPEYMALGAQRMREQKFEQAEEIFTHVLSLDPDNAAAHISQGICFASLGNVKYALQAMTRAVTLRPGSANYHTNLGELLRRAGRVTEAEASFRTALSIKPNDPEILSVLGLTLGQQSRSAEALQAFRAAVATGAPLPQAHLGIGKILAEQGQYREARVSYEAALAIAPAFSPARQALQELPASFAQPSPPEGKRAE